MEIKLTEEQVSAIEMVKKYNFCILTGGPGTGKTTTCNHIIQWAQSNDMEVCLCAPSGKAAKRMTEATGISASTIHSLLDAYMDNSGEFVFRKNEEDKLDCDLLICDEFSMVDQSLAADLFRAIDNNTKVLIVGDQDQLPSIGPGAVLRDLISVDSIPSVNLSKIHRNSGDIVKICHAIKNGNRIAPSEKLDIESGHNYRHIETNSASEIVNIIRDLVCKKIPARGYDPLWDLQVITATNERTIMSCESLNRFLQDDLNKDGRQPKINGCKFRPGDKVIQTKNDIVDGTRIVNGDIGHIKQLNEKELMVQFFNPDREVIFPTKANNLKLAYAITCHRFQGSESPVVIIPVHRSLSFLINKPWIYTAISRAKEICITVGQLHEIKKAARREASQKRYTRLALRLRGQL